LPAGDHRVTLRLHHVGLEPGPLAVLGLADGVHLALGIVADRVDLDGRQLVLDRLA
jgi:hypothetical protein